MPAADLAGALDDRLGAKLGGDDDVVASQRLAVFVEVAGAHDPARTHEAVALDQVAGDHAVDLQRHDLAVEDAQDAAQRAHPAQRPRPPGHGLWPGEVADDGLDHLGGDLRRLAAGARKGGEIDAVALHQGLAGDGGGPQETVDRRIGGAHARSLALLDAVFLTVGQPVDHQGQAPRPGKGGDAFEGQAGLRQALAGHALEVARRARLHARGNFLGEEFDQ